QSIIQLLSMCIVIESAGGLITLCDPCIKTIEKGGMQYTKCFLHPDIVASYDYTFILDEDLGLDDVEAEK
nr:uncharacterized protein [Tanacetum cinerariifolium]